jgi:hypothetical protein
MDRQRIVAHIWMWSLILIGIALAFLFVPNDSVFSSFYRSYIVIAVVPLFIFFLYYLATAIYFRTKFSSSSSRLEKTIRAGVYGRVAHPTCMTLAMAGWIFFIFYPDWRILASNSWMTFVVFFWIKVEENAFSEKEELPPEPDDVA